MTKLLKAFTFFLKSHLPKKSFRFPFSFQSSYLKTLIKKPLFYLKKKVFDDSIQPKQSSFADRKTNKICISKTNENNLIEFFYTDKMGIYFLEKLIKKRFFSKLSGIFCNSMISKISKFDILFHLLPKF